MGIQRDNLDGVTKVGLSKEIPLMADNKTWKGTTPEERKINTHGQMIGGLMHDAAQVYAAYLRCTPGIAPSVLESMAVESVLAMRKLLTEKIDE